MRINEIVGGMLKSPNIDETEDFSNTEVVGKREGYPIHKAEIYGSNALLILDSDGTYKGYILYKNDGHFIEAYVKEQFRRQGIMSTLILYVLRNDNIKLYINADDVVSDMSRNAFMTMVINNKIKILDKNTEKQFTNQELHRIFSSLGANDYALIIEHTHKQPRDNFYEIVNESGDAIYNKTFDGAKITEFFYD